MARKGSRWAYRKPLAQRLYDYLVEEPNSGCWIWIGSRNKDGYGQLVMWDSESQTKSARTAHRLSYEVWRGPIPDGMHICHTCDQPSCINPFHLFVGTAQDNVSDMFKKRRAGKARGERHGLARYSPAVIVAVQEALKQGRGQRVIADQFGISQSHVSRIKNGQTWRHLLDG